MPRKRNNTVSITCACGRSIVPANGPTTAPGLIVGEFPGKYEEREGKPFVGPSGRVLRAEFSRLGMNLAHFRITNIALHQFPGEDCYKFGMEQAIREARGKKAILLFGSECANRFIGKPVTTISGLRVKSEYLSAPLIIATLNPAALLTGTIGEFRLALEKFAKAYRRIK